MDRNLFRDHLAIDPNGLDVECIRQPEAFFHWAEEATKARGEMDRFELQLETIQAGLELDCRKEPKEFGLEPGSRGGAPTEAAIKAAVRIHPKYLEAQAKYHVAREDSSLLDKAVVAMEQKKRMLETLITLHGQSYFAGPSTPRNLGESYLAQKKASEDKLNDRQKKFMLKKKGKR